jgi:DNA-directed RNA polymerase specialized sigma24 family protein
MSSEKAFAGEPLTVAALLEQLAEEEKFILTLHLLRGLSAEAIASALGVPLRAVESVITIGKSRLISALNSSQSGD